MADSDEKAAGSVHDNATQHASEELLEQRLFLLTEAQYAAFLEALDNPPPAGPKLRALIRRRPQWERS